jgi:hypothetical protein
MTNKLYQFIVKGSGSFPATMLRRDKCYPVHDADVDSIFTDEWKYAESQPETVQVKTQGLSGTTMEDVVLPPSPTRLVYLQSNKRPNKERWQSFGWPVESCREVK